MFVEPIHTKKTGWIEVICGSMFSGKTEELIRRIKRAQIANQSVLVFKPELDTRYHKFNIVSHDSSQLESIPLESAKEILALAADTQVVGIDEAQFFDADIVNVVENLAKNGSRVIVAGLDMDFQSKPFGDMPKLLAIADYVTKLHAICMQCGQIAQFSYRKKPSEDQILLGETDLYEPRCRSCYYLGKEVDNC